MNNQLEQLMSHGREISMTATEHAAMRHRVLAYTLSHHPRITAATGAWSWVRQHAAMSTILTAMLVLGGAGVSASMAGPNDALYGFRLQVNDRIEAAAALGEDAQLDVELRQIERQLDAEEGVFDKALADDEQNEILENKKSEDLNLKDQKESEDDGLEAELRQVERELQQEESEKIELEN